MTCTNPVLDEDGEIVCPCGDEGRSCEACQEAAAREAWADWLTTGRAERDPEGYREDMKLAGRGHLLP